MLRFLQRREHDEEKSMSWLKKLFQVGNQPQIKRDTQPSKTLTIDEFASTNADILAGWELCVTLSTQTPLKWLLRHKERAAQPSDVPPQYAIWVPITKTFRELGIEIDEAPSGTMASEIGQVPADGGGFLPFLIEYRTIVEAETGRTELISALDALGAKYPDITSRLGGSLAEKFVTSELQELDGCGKVTALRLFTAGFLGKSDVLAASIEDLTAVAGVGRKTAETLLQNRTN